jgi:hypothetical protein
MSNHTDALAGLSSPYSSTEVLTYTSRRFDKLDAAVASLAAPPVDPPPVDPPPVDPPPVDPPPPTGIPAGVTLQPIDGGTSYHAKFAGGLPTDPNFWPVAVWFEATRTQADIDKDKGCGLNTYVALVSDSNGPLIRANGMHTIVESPISGQGSELAAHLVGDEQDMAAEGGGWWASPNANHFKVLQDQIDRQPKDGLALWNNFGKGLGFGFVGERDAEARMAKMVDYVSVDLYFFTDSDTYQANQGGTLLGINRDLTPAENRRASNYGAGVQKMRELVDRSRPVWGFVEVGGPWSYNGTTANPYITPAQVRAAVWHCVIAGAQGITYFNHSFGGPAQSQHCLREPYYAPVRAVVTSVNAQITDLASVLNSPTAVGYVTAPASVKVLTKWSDRGRYVFAGSTNNAASTPTFTVAGGGAGAVEVVGEGRTLQMVDGKFSDNFADGNAVHIYKL